MDISRSFFRRIASRDDRAMTNTDKQKEKYEEIDDLSGIADVEKQLERYQRDTLRAIRPQQIYCMGFFENKNGLYRISREVELSVLTKPVELRIVAKEFEHGLKYSGYKYIHQGMYIIGIKGMTRKKLGAKVLITLLDKRWDTIDKAALGFLEGDMNENMLITYIAPDLMMPVKEFIDKMSFGFQTKGYEEFKGTNLLVSIEFIGRLTNRSGSKYKININDVIENMHSKGITFMSPLKISSEERAGEEWKISELIQSKTLTQPESYISYQNNKGNTSIRFTNYKSRTTEDLDVESSDRNIIDNRRHSVSEFMERLDQDSEIKYYEDKLKNIAEEYNASMKSEWPKIRDKELYFYRELARIKKLKKDKDKIMEASKTQESKIEQVKPKEQDEKGKEKQKDSKELSEEEQWEENEKLLLESYEEENNLIEEMGNIEEEVDYAEHYHDFLDSLDDIGLHNLENAMEAMDMGVGSGKRKRYGEGYVKNEGERERPARAAGRWPPEKEEYSYNYIPGQYRYMGSRRRDFEKPVKFQNQKGDGAVLNLAAHDPIDWPNIISIWKGLIVQKYIQNQHNIGNKVEDMITYLETFLGESAKVLWEQWVENNPNNYEELKRAGSNPHNFANVISNIIIAEDPELGYTTLQNERLKEIEKLTLTSWKGIKEFSQHYLYNATTAKQGYNKGIVERYFNKLPDPLGSMIFEEYKKETEGAEINISQAITFVFKQLRKICTSIQAQRSMKYSDYDFCNKIVQIPLAYGEDKPRSKRNHRPQNRNNNNIRTRKRYFLRRSDNRAPFLHKRNVRRYNPKKTYDRTCRCFICNSPDHLSRTCPNKDQKRYSSKYEEQERVLIIDSVNENILVCDDEIKDDESIYSIIETDEVENIATEYESSDEELDLIDELAGIKIEMMDQLNCEHDWVRGKGDYNIKCAFCIYYPSQDNRATCSICLKQACVECIKVNKQKWRKEVEYESDEKILSSRVRVLENRINKLEVELENLKTSWDPKVLVQEEAIENTEYKDQVITLKNHKDQVITLKNHNTSKIIQLKDAITSFGNKYIVRLPFKEVLGIRIPVKVKLSNKLSFSILALVDTGCTKNIIHDKFFMRCPELVHTIDDHKADVSTDMSGIKKLHNQLAYNVDIYINGTKYIIDEITVRDLSVINDEMIIGLRFLQKSVQTTVIHEDGITFIPYQDNVHYISEVRKRGGNTNLDNINAIESNLDLAFDPYIDLEEAKVQLSENIESFYISNSNTECVGLQSFAPNWYRDIKSKRDIEKIVQRLEDIQIIGEIPMKYWEKNSITCKINIINP